MGEPVGCTQLDHEPSKSRAMSTQQWTDQTQDFIFGSVIVLLSTPFITLATKCGPLRPFTDSKRHKCAVVPWWLYMPLLALSGFSLGAGFYVYLRDENDDSLFNTGRIMVVTFWAFQFAKQLFCGFPGVTAWMCSLLQVLLTLEFLGTFGIITASKNWTAIGPLIYPVLWQIYDCVFCCSFAAKGDAPSPPVEDTRNRSRTNSKSTSVSVRG